MGSVEYVCLNSSNKVKQCTGNFIALPIVDAWGIDRLNQYGQCIAIDVRTIYEEDADISGLFHQLTVAQSCSVQFALDNFTAPNSYNVIRETVVSKVSTLTAALC